MIQLSCLTCNECETIDLAETIRRLRAGGKLRRDADPDLAIVSQLALLSAAEWACRSCGEIGLTATPHELEGDDSWGASPCAMCNKPIPPARLEIFPDAERCAACQAKYDAGDSDDEYDYCPRCGNIMQMKSTSRGITRFKLTCPTCR